MGLPGVKFHDFFLWSSNPILITGRGRPTLQGKRSSDPVHTQDHRIAAERATSEAVAEGVAATQLGLKQKNVPNTT